MFFCEFFVNNQFLSLFFAICTRHIIKTPTVPPSKSPPIKAKNTIKSPFYNKKIGALPLDNAPTKINLQMLLDDSGDDADCNTALFINVRYGKADIIFFARCSAVIAGMGNGIDTV